MKIALAQVNPVIGAFAQNCREICDAINRAKRKACDLIVFPELALTGAPPRGLLADPGFVPSSQLYWDPIIQASHSLGVICGVIVSNPKSTDRPYSNSAIFCADGVIKAIGHKRVQPVPDVFGEGHFFETGKESPAVDFRGVRIGLSIGDEILEGCRREPRDAAADSDSQRHSEEWDTDILIVLAARPYMVGDQKRHQEAICSFARRHALQIAYVNQVGGNDGVIFQGHSLAVGGDGVVHLHGADFEEDLLFWETTAPDRASPRALTKESEILSALRLGIHDYSRKCGYSSAVVILAGDVSSAVTACLAKLVYGTNGVKAVIISCEGTEPGRIERARNVAANLGLTCQEVNLGKSIAAMREVLVGLDVDDTTVMEAGALSTRLSQVALSALGKCSGSLLLQAAGPALGCGSPDCLVVLEDIPWAMIRRLAESLRSEYGWIPEGLFEGAGEIGPAAGSAQCGNGLADTLPRFESGRIEGSVSQISCSRLPSRHRSPSILQLSGRASVFQADVPIAHGYRPEPANAGAAGRKSGSLVKQAGAYFPRS